MNINMKKTISAFAAAAILFSTALPLFAQKSGAFSTRKIFRADGIFSSNQAFSEGRGVWLEWQTADETDVVGFHVYRVNGKRGKEAVSQMLISGTALSALPQSGKTYNFFDARGGLDTIYVVEAVTQSGRALSSSSFAARYTDDLSQVAGDSSENLLRRASEPSNPTVTKENLELPKDLAQEVETASRAASDSFAPIDTQKWVASQPGAKIGVRQDGLYRVTRAQLQAVGFDVNAPTANWQLYTDGIEQPINVAANGDFIEFYGRGIDKTETNTRIYYLIAGPQAGKRFGSTVVRRLSGTIVSNSYLTTTFKKDNFSFVNTILNGDASNFYGALVTASGGTTNFNLTSVDFSAPTAKIEINIQGFTFTPHQIRVVLNDTELGIINGANRDIMLPSYEIPTASLREGANVLKLFSLAPNSNSFTDHVKITYRRRYVANQNRLSFYTENYRASRVQGFTSSTVRVLDLTDAQNPRFVDNAVIVPNGNNFDLVLPASRARVLYAVTDNALLTPVSVTANAPSTLSIPTNAGGLVIIAYKDLMIQAENWANYRRNDGMNVKVVNVEDIHDEFSYGLPTADSINDFLKYAKNNWQTPPNYVFLIGDASFDPLNIAGVGNFNFVPAKMVDTTYMETGSDDALADFDNDGLAEIPIGRIPVRNGAQVTQLLAKVTAFEQGLAQAQSRGALCVSDLPDGYNFEGVCTRLMDTLTSSITKTFVNRSASDARTQVLNAINGGKYVLNYAGHGSVASWAGNMLHRDDVAGLTNTNNNLVIANMLTCLNGYYIEILQDGLSEAMVKKAEGGAVVSWASSGLTTPDVQEIMANRFYQQIGTSSMTRMGDFVRDAKTTIAGGRDVRLSWVLLGDPTLKIQPAPTAGKRN
jgi:hypothetical protein